MVIAHVITRLLRAGSEENTISSCLAQARDGHSVVLVHGDEWNAEQVARCSPFMQVIAMKELVHRIDLRSDIAATRAMANLFKKLRPTVVHTHQSKAGIVGRVAAKLARVPVVIHGVHIVPFASVGRLQKLTYLAAERAVAGYTDAFVNVSEGTKRSYIEHSVGRPEQHFVAHSGFDLKSFRTALPPEDWRQLCGVGAVEEKPPVVLMLAALEERKRHVAFIEAFARVRERIPTVRLLLAGEGPMRVAITATIARLGLESNVKLLGFHCQPERLIALADLTVLTSMREGLPRVIVQSFAGGKPVVTTALPGIEDLIADGVNGLITPANDVQRAADAVAELLSDDARMGRMQHHARQTDISAWDVESMCRQLSEIYGRFVPDDVSLQPLDAGRHPYPSRSQDRASA